jgi:hypothetical protein
VLEVLFVLSVLISAVVTNKSVNRLERGLKELGDIVYKDEPVLTAQPVKKKRTRKPRAAKEIV